MDGSTAVLQSLWMAVQPYYSHYRWQHSRFTVIMNGSIDVLQSLCGRQYVIFASQFLDKFPSTPANHNIIIITTRPVPSVNTCHSSVVTSVTREVPGECGGMGEVCGECDGLGEVPGECGGMGEVPGECGGMGEVCGECDGMGKVSGECDRVGVAVTSGCALRILSVLL